jgi:hypothetical protein
MTDILTCPLRLGGTFEGPSPQRLRDQIFQLPMFQESLPSEIWVDDVEQEVIPDWRTKYADSAQRQLQITWGRWDVKTISFRRKSITSFGNDFAKPTVSEMMSLLRGIDFLVATFSTHNEWSSEEIDYAAPSFAGGQKPLGWGCAFKGKGHDRLVSRRYLDYGPWRVIHNEEHDIILIQFHDLEADAQTALEQAREGHFLMADPYQGGYIQKNYRIENPDFSGLYTAEEKLLEFVPGAKPTRAEYLDACAIRHHQLLGEEKPVERVAFMFVDENEARENLFDCWVRELECWTIIKGERIRLDLDYVPPPYEKPEWINALE